MVLPAGFSLCRYQGTTLVVPPRRTQTTGFSRWPFVGCFQAACFIQAEQATKSHCIFGNVTARFERLCTKESKRQQIPPPGPSARKVRKNRGRAGFSLCRYQGTTLVVPPRRTQTTGFSRWPFVGGFQAVSFVQTELGLKALVLMHGFRWWSKTVCTDR